MRREGFTNAATYEEIISMSIKSRNTQFDVLDSDCEYKRENFTKLLSFYNEHNSGKELSDKALQSMGFFAKIRFLKMELYFLLMIILVQRHKSNVLFLQVVIQEASEL